MYAIRSYYVDRHPGVEQALEHLVDALVLGRDDSQRRLAEALHVGLDDRYAGGFELVEQRDFLLP